MPGLKTNERPGTRAVLRHSRVSAYKAREVLNLIRGQDFERAAEILEFCERDVADAIGKLLNSAAANARHNDGLDPEEMYVSACFADEGTTLKRWRPRARGRATRIRKRTCHITVIVSRLPDDRLERRRARQATETAGLRSRRVAASRRGEKSAAGTETPSSASDTAETDVLDLEATSTDDLVETEDGVDAEDEGAEAAAVVTDEDGEFEEPAWLDEELGTDTDQADAEVEEEAAPAAKPRRARTARKTTTKADADGDADASDAGAAGDEEKG